MKNFILKKYKSVLLCTLIVVCICGCGKNTAQYISSEKASSESASGDYSGYDSEKNSDDTSDNNSSEKNNTENEENAQETASSAQQTDDRVQEELLYVYICGAVNQPGVYTLSEGSRVCDLFEAAGGLREDAATDYWNQARLLADGEMLYVPTIDEAKERQWEQWNPIETSSQSADANTNDKNGKINLNTASLEELMEIPGIGESKAKAIIAYREEHDGFSSIEEVMNIEGIKDGVFSKMKEYIVIN